MNQLSTNGLYLKLDCQMYLSTPLSPGLIQFIFFFQTSITIAYIKQFFFRVMWLYLTISYSSF